MSCLRAVKDIKDDKPEGPSSPRYWRRWSSILLNVSKLHETEKEFKEVKTSVNRIDDVLRHGYNLVSKLDERVKVILVLLDPFLNSQLLMTRTIVDLGSFIKSCWKNQNFETETSSVWKANIVLLMMSLVRYSQHCLKTSTV